MRVRMLVSLSGTHDGHILPAAGDEVDLPDVTAAHLLADGRAELVTPPEPAQPEAANRRGPRTERR